MTLRMVEATQDHFQALLYAHAEGRNRLRQRDVDEWFYLNGCAISFRLRNTAGIFGPNSRVILDEDNCVLAMWGLYEHYGWLVGTDKGQERAREIHRFHRRFLSEVEAPFILAVTIYPEDDKWHRALGFRHVKTYREGSLPVYLYERTT